VVSIFDGLGAWNGVSFPAPPLLLLYIALCRQFVQGTGVFALR
jgi:hypothetical protein